MQAHYHSKGRLVDLPQWIAWRAFILPWSKSG